MKRFAVLCTLMALLLFSLNGYAAKKEKGDYLREKALPRLLGHLTATPLYFSGMIFQHEAMHGIAAIVTGHEVNEFHPFPHSHWENGVSKSRLGDMGYQYLTDEKQDRSLLLRNEVFVSGAPYLANFLIFVSSDLTLTLGVDAHSPAALFLLFGGMIYPLIDWTNNFLAKRGSDIHILCDVWNVDYRIVAGVGVALSTLAAIRILRHTIAIFSDEPAIRRPKNRRVHFTGVVPWADRTATGLSTVIVF